MPKAVPIEISGRVLKMHKCVKACDWASSTVLTDDPWMFVDLWLRRNKKAEAQYYWSQALSFHNASMGMPLEAAPLLLYYSFMNGTKALLSAKGCSFNERHGVSRDAAGGTATSISLRNEGVKIWPNGVLPALSAYFAEAEVSDNHTMQQLLFNLPYIHRTYCLTYRSQTPMYIPLVKCRYVADTATKKARFEAEISQDFRPGMISRRLPSAIELSTPESDSRMIQSVQVCSCQKPRRPSSTDIDHLTQLHQGLRRNIQYINGAQTLWYLKTQPSGPGMVDRQPLTITLAAMHRLSELSRYRPMQLAKFLSGSKNWLLSEFIRQSPSQFTDAIAAEITGHRIMSPNVRPAT